MTLDGHDVRHIAAGVTWTQTALKAHGYAFGIDMLPGGAAGYAVTCSIGGMAGCGIWRYDGA